MTLRTSDFRPCEINGAHQQSKANEDEQKPVLDLPRAFSPLVLKHTFRLESSTKQEEKYGKKTSRYVIQLLRNKSQDEQACTATKKIKLEEA